MLSGISKSRGEIIWDESYSVGVKELDEQHQQIIKIVNRLIKEKDLKVNSETISDVLAELTQYAEFHFRIEEEYMKKHDFPGYSVHKELHSTFRLQLITFAIEIVAEKETIPDEVIDYLKNWWLKHILKSDMKFKKYFENDGVN